MPDMIADRLGWHTAATTCARWNVIPCEAKASSAGVTPVGPPNEAGVRASMSSAVRSRMFFGIVSGPFLLRVGASAVTQEIGNGEY